MKCLSKIDDGDVVGKVHLAELLFRLDDWEGTSDTLLPLTDGQYDTPLLRNLVSSLYNADRRSDLNRILGSLPKSVASIEFYIRIKAAYYERIGEISQAKTAFEEAIIIRPADLGLRLHWLQCCLQSDRMDQIQEFLSGPLSFPKAMSDERAHLLHWQDQFGDSARALKDAYHFRRERYNDPAAHRALISILLFGGHARGGFQPVDSVGVDTAVRLVQVGSEAQTLIIESGTNPDRSRGEFSPDSDIAARLLGAKKGDEVELQGTKVRSDRWIVEEILPKEVHAFRSSLKEFNSLFPEEQGFIRVNTDPEDMTPAIEEMTALTTARGDFVKQAAGLYQEMPLPLAAIAAICGHNVIDTWVGLALTGESILVAGGAHEERDAAIDLSETSRFFIIDPLNLYMLEDIGVADKILNSLGPFGIAQSSILLLEQLAAERKEAAGKELTLASSSSGRLSLQTYSKQATKASYDKAKRVLDLAKSQRILPAQADADPSHDMRQVGSFMHSAFLDTVICAKGTGGTLICEDLRIRQWADRYLDGKSVWIQPLLMVARNRGTLSPRDYTKSLVRLISLGHTFVSIDSNSLYEVASSGRVRKGDLALLMGRLESHTIELQSLTGVLTKYLADLWASPLRPKTKVLFTRKAAKILAKRWSKSQEIPRALTRLIMPEAARGQRRSYERAMREFYRD
jgi:transcription elongation GreA/GreB family factor